MFEPPRFASMRAAAPESNAPPIVAGVLPVTAGVLPMVVEGALIEGLLTTGAGGTMGATGVLPTIAGALPMGAGVLNAGEVLVIGGVLPVRTGVVPLTDGVAPTGDGVLLPLTAGALPGMPVTGATLVCAKAGMASIVAAARRQVRAFME
jgi:hypothetical protein